MKHKLLFLLFALSMSVFAAHAQTSYWQYNPHDYEYDMTAYVSLNGYSKLSNFEIAAFCGVECRGIAEIIDAGKRQVGYLRIRSNVVSGEVITFKVFKKDTQQELELNSNPVSFAVNTTLGTPSNPFQLQIPGSYLPGDLNYDNKVDIADAVTILNIMATSEYNWEADINGDNKVDIADFVTILNIMAQQITPRKLVTEIVLSETSLSLQPNEMKILTATVLPENADNKAVTWESNDNSIATVDQTGKVTAQAIGSCIITCSATDDSGIKADCIVIVSNSDTPDTHEYVDLGLPSGTLWATCNVGANAPEEYGDYFAWGETTGYNSGKKSFKWNTYKYCKGSNKTLTKYCLDSGYGTVDNKTVLEPEDDAATANWGSAWQMPSIDQYKELINSSYTTTEWTSLNGKYGRKITSKSNGKSIFLPAAGDRYSSNLSDAGSNGYYWSRSLDPEYSYYAFFLYLKSDDIYTYSYYYRYYGQSVRPVRVNTVE